MPIPEQNRPTGSTASCLSSTRQEVSSHQPPNEQESHVPKAWHQIEVHRPIRDAIIVHICELLRSRFPDKRDDSIRKISERFEKHIYHSADSLGEYTDPGTLKQRLFQYALSRREGPAPCPSCGSRCESGQTGDTPVCSAGPGCPGAAREPLVLLREQQHLILQLRHASRCSQGSQCVLQHCAALRDRWTHCSACRDTQCPTPQCVSTRHVLNHYTMCQASQCRLCRPVKELIRRVQLTEQSISQSDSATRRVIGALPGGKNGASSHRVSTHLLSGCCAHPRTSKRSRDDAAATAEKRPRVTSPQGPLPSAVRALWFMTERAAMKGLVYSIQDTNSFETDSEDDYD